MVFRISQMLRRSIELAFLAAFIGGTCFGIPSVAIAADRHRFSSDEFIVFGTGPDGSDLLLTLMLCRKQDETSGHYLHYRFASLIGRSINVDLVDSFDDPNEKEVPHGFLRSFEAQPAADLSAREAFRIGLSLEGTELAVTIPDLQGDFVVKSNPDYLKILSESAATVVLNGASASVRAVHEKIHSEDYRPHVFFPGYGKTASETNAFVLWDQSGNLYVIDTSDVRESNPSYRSHTWVLHKDTRRGLMQKGFEAHVAVSEGDKGSLRWTMSLPSLDVRRLELSAAQSKQGKPYEGIARGTIDSGGELRLIQGYYVRHVYPQR